MKHSWWGWVRRAGQGRHQAASPSGKPLLVGGWVGGGACQRVSLGWLLPHLALYTLRLQSTAGIWPWAQRSAH